MKLFILYVIGIFCLAFTAYEIAHQSSWFFHHYFLITEIGYLFFLDALVYSFRKRSLLMNRFGAFVGYAFISAGYWSLLKILDELSDTWASSPLLEGPMLMEGFWVYLKDMTYFPTIVVSLSLFSPRFEKPFKALSNGRALGLFSIGVFLLFLYLIFPHPLFPFLWVFPLFLIDPWNWRRGRFSLFASLWERRYRTLLFIACASLLAGLFWEGLNSLDPSGWRYHLPYFAWLRIFQMPLLGYLGYIFFGSTVVSFLVFLKGSWGQSEGDSIL